MKNNSTLLLLFCMFTQLATAQSDIEKIITGKISSETGSLEGINVINTSSKNNTVSDKNGFFSIHAKEGDILSFSAVNYESLRKIINKQEFNSGNIIVNLTPKSIDLQEVIINEHPEITAENMGIIPRDQIKLTPAERKLQTAGDFKPIHLLGLLGGYLAVDPILNAISGRTNMLKKELKVEKKEFLMTKLEALFEDKYYIETLKIQEEHIKGFQYYCIEDPYFATALNSKNKTMSMFLIVSLAEKYNQNRIDEK